MSPKGIAAFGLGLFALGLLTHAKGAAVGGAYLAAAAGLGLVYSKASLKHLVYRREFSSRKAMVGDEISVRIGVENRKPLPVLWLKCDDEVPGAEVLGGLPALPGYKPERATLRNMIFLKWFERVVREFNVKCLARGVFRFGPVVLESGDIMGFKETLAGETRYDTLTVFPRMVPIHGIAWEEQFPRGDAQAAGWLHPDPLTIVGTRPYARGTPAKRMAWRATAKTGAFQEKLLKPSVQRSVVVCLNLSTKERYWQGADLDSLERAIFVCASLCRELVKLGAPFGLLSNSVPVSPSHFGLVIPPGSSQGHFLRVLETLAALRMPWTEFRTTLGIARKSLQPDVSLLVVLPKQLEADWEEIIAIVGTGTKVTVVVFSSEEDFVPFYKKVTTYLVPSSVNWRSSEVIQFEPLA